MSAKDAKALRRQVAKLGYRVEPNGGGHYNIRDRDGRLLVDPHNGHRLGIANSPNSRAVTNTRAALRRAGVAV